MEYVWHNDGSSIGDPNFLVGIGSGTSQGFHVTRLQTRMQHQRVGSSGACRQVRQHGFRNHIASGGGFVHLFHVTLESFRPFPPPANGVVVTVGVIPDGDMPSGRQAFRRVQDGDWPVVKHRPNLVWLRLGHHPSQMRRRPRRPDVLHEPGFQASAFAVRIQLGRDGTVKVPIYPLPKASAWFRPVTPPANLFAGVTLQQLPRQRPTSAT